MTSRHVAPNSSMSPLPLDCVRAVRLRPRDRDNARQLFAAMAEVFDELASPRSDANIDRLLSRDDFWAVAAFVGEELAGGVTAHTLPMSRSDGSELFIYDVAVRRRYQRTGVGRLLLETTCQLAAQAGIHLSFVLAENIDTHALDFYRALGATESSVTLFTFERNGQ
jgi:aminoglycoside 3-N-acetyltransferase I